MAQEIISGNVKNAYDEFYKTHDEAWRMLGAKYKAYHVMDVCKGQTFNKVLEVGAGDGSILKKLSDYNFAPEYHAVEISESGVAHIKARDIKNLVSVQEFDGYKLPFEDDSFDLVILSHVLEHVEHERLLLREIKRVSKNFVIEVPIDYKPNVDKRIKHFMAYGHINVYTPTSLRYLLQTEGFEIKKDLPSIIGPEVTRFNTFINQKKPRSFVNRFKILATFAIKNTVVELSEKFRERLANAYTVLCTKTGKQADIF
ncbi:class I SAM-dependent methyltransferase [Mucilaginibacter terrigena]|uniref:Class I SAM-dependent methyltransferase n=1 Tax=Mucilaginibacter terrigena TaxID=2492395 RepID=A0A4Q5LGV3_9SPHI|nr:class I SAM-dependent methyltransferase [Mucilaginibacter terrigena]RYU85882.1 class I SAM-dependent methyltransferase [Mucilaginibacter terrigena]